MGAKPATLDLTAGRAEIVAGRGSFTESFPPGSAEFRITPAFRKKPNLLLAIRDNEIVTWSGKFHPALKQQAIYPRPLQNPGYPSG